MMYSIALWFGTGSVPGWPRHTGQTLVFGSAPNTLAQPQNIFVAVESSTWHSRPMTASHSAMACPTLTGPPQPCRPQAYPATPGPRARSVGAGERRVAGPGPGRFELLRHRQQQPLAAV